MKNTNIAIAALAAAVAAITGFFIGRSASAPAAGIAVVSSMPRKAAEDAAHLSALQIGNAWVGQWNAESYSMAVPISGNLIPVIRTIAPQELQVGALAVFMTETGEYHLHQVLAVSESGFLPAGTNNARSDGWIPWSRFHGEAIQFFLYQ